MTNITSFTDRNNQPILVGQTIKDEFGTNYLVEILGSGYVVYTTDRSNVMGLSLFMALSDWVEIVVPAQEPDKAAVAMAPLDKEHNLTASQVIDEICTLPKQKK